MTKPTAPAVRPDASIRAEFRAVALDRGLMWAGGVADALGVETFNEAPAEKLAAIVKRVRDRAARGV